MSTESGAPLRLILVDDHPVVVEGLAALLGSQPGLAVVATGHSGEDAVALFDRERPDVTLVDLRMPGCGGVAAIARIRSIDPDARIVVLTTFDTDEEIYRALAAGASGYLLKTASPQDLIRAVRDVAAGRRAIPPEVAAKLAERITADQLTGRELEVLQAVAEGAGNREIARRFDITEGTVKGHLYNVFAKLGVKSRTQAVAAAIARGLVRPHSTGD